MNGVFILALDVTWFMPLDEFCAQVDELTAYVKAARPAPGVARVYTPGERSREEAVRLSREGIPLDAETWATIEETLEDLGVRPKLSRQ